MVLSFCSTCTTGLHNGVKQEKDGNAAVTCEKGGRRLCGVWALTQALEGLCNEKGD